MAIFDPTLDAFVLADDEQDFTLTEDQGPAGVIGNDLANTITGNSQDNILSGGGGDDLLIGGAGLNFYFGDAGTDTMRGGINDDVYIIDASDVIEGEIADGGNDRIVAGFSFALDPQVAQVYAFIESLRLDGSADINGTGNALDNTIDGNDGKNRLEGGGGDDWLLGGAGEDTLVGGANDDDLDGGIGADRLEGGTGNDLYRVNDVGDVVVEAAGEGDWDEVQASVDFSIANTGVERLYLLGNAISGTGNDLNNEIRGNNKANVLDGGNGNDTLNGGQGADAMTGGVGDDVYIADDIGDRFIEMADQGYDKVTASVSIDLSVMGDQVEELTLSGGNFDGAGNELGNKITGSSGNNKLSGHGGADTIQGGRGSDILDGGAGADRLVGGEEDDTYIIDADDTIEEAENQGRDTVQVNFNYTLKDNFEDLTLTGTNNIDGNGNSAANFIRGNAGSNTLIGLDGDDSLMGGAGADRMEGGAGSDLYWVDNAGDVIVDSGAGFDRVLASVNYTLGANIEYLAFEGSGNFIGTGNDLDNTMYGNVGANMLDGGAGRDQLDGGEGNDKLSGGAGDDTISDWKGDDVIDGGAGKDDLRGGVGNDTYLVDALDTVTELAGQGTDTVTASASFALGSLAEVEVLLAQAGSTAINLTGNDIVNTVTGNDGANQIRGQGGNDALNGGLGNDTIFSGLGSDVLTGGKGKDRFVFDTLLDAKSNVDQILDFKAKDDTFALENAIFTKLGKKTGTLKASMFYIGKKAHDKDDRIVYDKKAGALSYDADGTGKMKAVKFATVKKGTFLDHHDFLVI